MSQTFYAQSFSDPAAVAAAPDFAAARMHMIESQLRPNKVTDPRILDIMGRLPRELFVPSNLVGVAYLDEDIPLIGTRTLMQPMVLARLIQAANVQQGEVVLDLAPATGYSTLVFAALTNSVFGVEPDATLHREAARNITTYASGRGTVLAGAPVEGCIGHAPFDVIFINGSVEVIPQLLFNQLNEGGRLIAVERQYGAGHISHTGHARLHRKVKGVMIEEELFDANIRPAPGFAAPQVFKF